MARSLRIEYPGAYYHVVARGNQRKTIFIDDDDRNFFLKTLGEACGMTGWRVHAWVLMDNHYHLFIETPEANLVSSMKWMQNLVTRRHNLRHGLVGPLFGDRYKAVPVEGADDSRYRTLSDYIHLNPVRARLVRPGKGDSVLDYPWSSLAGGYVLPPGKRPKWMAAAEGLARLGLPDSAPGRKRLVARLDRRAADEKTENCGVPELEEDFDVRRSHLRRGWFWGGPEFEKKMRRLAADLGAGKPKPAFRRKRGTTSHGMVQAEAWVREGLKAAGLKPKDLASIRGTDPRKLALAELLWKRTTASQGWIAEKLAMGSAANIGQKMRLLNVDDIRDQLPPQLRRFLKDAGKGFA